MLGQDAVYYPGWKTKTEKEMMKSYHKFKVGNRVRIKGTNDEELDGRHGEIVGIATDMPGVLSSYIVKFDEPMAAPKKIGGKDWECGVLVGGFLEKVAPPTSCPSCKHKGQHINRTRQRLPWECHDCGHQFDDSGNQ